MLLTVANLPILHLISLGSSFKLAAWSSTFRVFGSSDIAKRGNDDPWSRKKSHRQASTSEAEHSPNALLMGTLYFYTSSQFSIQHHTVNLDIRRRLLT